MLPLLDLHGIKRIDFHNSVLEDLRDKLIAQIAEVGASLNSRERDRKLKVMRDFTCHFEEEGVVRKAGICSSSACSRSCW